MQLSMGTRHCSMASNVIPPIAYASGDIRTISAEQTKQVEAKMTQIVSEHLEKTDASIEFHEGYPAMEATVGNRALLGILNKVNSDASLPHMQELDPLQRGAGIFLSLLNMTIRLPAWGRSEAMVIAKGGSSI
jgi:metal-dependent amidase/aminoacylase/carboxypeptidase family protein